MSSRAVLLEVLAALEPDASLRDIDTATGTDRLARPFGWSADRLYGWAGEEGYVQEGDGSLDRIEFTLRIGWGAAETPHYLAGQRTRTTGDALFAKVDAVVTWVRGHRSGATYENLAVPRVDYEALVTDQVRGVVFDLVGYRLITS